MNAGRPRDGQGAYPDAPPTEAAAIRPPGGVHVGRVRVTPARLFLALALIGGLAFLAYSILFRDALQVPLMASGFAVCGIVFGIAAAMSVGAVVRAGREGRDGAAVITALVGGLLAVGSLMSLAAAAIMIMIWSGTNAA